MDLQFALEPIQAQLSASLQDLEVCNRMTKSFGLALSPAQMQELTERRFLALKSTGRVEFGKGVIQKLVHAFCDSPSISQENYEETLLELQDIFYYFKNESMEQYTDDELIDAMKTAFDGSAHGSTELLAGTSLETLARLARGGESDEENEMEAWFQYGREDEPYEE